MARTSLEALKQMFRTGYKPTQQDWYNLIDSFVHLDLQTAVDQQVVNTKLSAYDTTLKAQQTDGVVNTLGDVFGVMTGYSDTRRLNEELKWSGIPNKPGSIDVTWTEQTIVTDTSTYNPLGASGSVGSGPTQRWLLSTVAGITGKYHVIDLQMNRRWVQTGSESGYYTDIVTGVKVAINPKVNL